VSHLATVQGIYAAFGRGDVPAILGCLAEDVVWEYGQPSTDVPWLQSRRGRAAVVGFFEALGAVEFARLEATTFLESGPTVVVLLQLDATVKATGRRVLEEDEVHIWHFDAAGQVSRFRHRLDTHLHQLAYHGR
jgi:ketosteroid isomerase-like protein